MREPLVSAVALTWNSRRFVPAFLRSMLAELRSLEQTSGAAGGELFVVDNGSTDGTLDALAEFGAEPEFTIVRLRKNWGTTVARNAALRRARGRYVLVVDSDTQLPTGSLSALVAAHADLERRGENVGLVAPRLVYPDGRFQESARRFPTLWTKLLRLAGSERRRAEDESEPAVLAQRQTPVDYAISAAWLLKRSLLEQVGYLDERIFYAPEDLEFCARLWSRGHSVWYCPNVTLIHDCQQLTRRKPLSGHALSHARGLVRYWQQYGGYTTRPSRATAEAACSALASEASPAASSSAASSSDRPAPPAPGFVATETPSA